MKKVVCILLSLVICIGFSACGNSGSGSTSSPPPSGSLAQSSSTQIVSSGGQAIEADVGLFTVELTLPASLYTLGSTDLTEEEKESKIEEAVERAKQQDGILDATRDADGNVVLTLTRAKHQELLDEAKAAIEEMIAKYTDGETVQSIKTIVGKDNFSVFDVEMDKASAGPMDTMIGLPLAMSGCMYLAYAGEDSPRVTINFIDEATGDVFQTTVYPDDFSS